MTTTNRPLHVEPADAPMTVFDAIYSLRATRVYQDRPVPPEVMDQILQAGTMACSSGNTQPWEFVVVTDEETTRAIGDIYVDYYDRSYADEDPGFPVDNKRWMQEVPVYIVPIGDRRIPEKAYPQVEGEEQLNEEIFQHSIANAIYAIWLAATTMGLSTTSASCFTHHKERIRELLDIPDVYDIPATLPIGYPRKYQQTRYREPLDTLVHRGSYDRSLFRSEEELLEKIEQIRRSRYRGDGELIPRDRLGIE